MNTTLKRTILAAAMATVFCASAAYASEGNNGDHHHRNSDPVHFDKKIKLTSDVTVSGDPTVTGNINVNAAAISIVDNAQTNGNNYGANENLSNRASAGDNAAQNSSGNIGANIVAGDNNQQDNAAALSAADASFTFGMADAEVFVNQAGAYNGTSNVGVTNAASIDQNAFQNASGNIGANVAAGNNNQQKNAMSASVATTSFAQASVSSHQASANNQVSNSGFVQQYNDTVRVSMSGNVSGGTVALGLGGYNGTSSGTYSGSTSSTSSSSGMAYQANNFYPDSWSGASHPAGSSTGHIDFDSAAQGAIQNPNRPGVGGFAFDTSSSGSSSGSESGTTSGSQSGNLGFVELGAANLYADLSGSVVTTRWVINDATNTASLGGSAFSNASGNIGINIASGTGNQQANSLAMAVAQPSTGGGNTGGGGE